MYLQLWIGRTGLQFRGDKGNVRMSQVANISSIGKEKKNGAWHGTIIRGSFSKEGDVKCPSHLLHWHLSSLHMEDGILPHKSWTHQNSICITVGPCSPALPKKHSKILQKEMIQSILI